MWSHAMPKIIINKQVTACLMHEKRSHTKTHTMQSYNAQSKHNYLKITILSLSVLAVLISNEAELVGLLTTVGNIYMYVYKPLGKDNK